ncbi:PREDICTED: uncharacterized protein LOC108765354 [Trachymyrmex cornetzi]|uniref:uncharacterized protein LOC108765354 n=1 Tax=Trachymyrmex cornetzi TaxID=471704 RepID=UPI00084F3A0B|nr:PREDICTED: uncharacterized protein LOC108765354 [Trachymyrmex cornetzi]
MGLSVALEKTEAIGFHRRGRPANIKIRVAGQEIPIDYKIKYLGLTMDSRWTFEPYFRSLAPKFERMAAGLAGFLPNLGGPGDRVRLMYANVTASVALYDAPVWHREAEANRRIRGILRASQRRLVGRAIKAYKTTSFAANTALAGMSPFELMAGMRAEIFEKTAAMKQLTRAVAIPTEVSTA